MIMLDYMIKEVRCQHFFHLKAATNPVMTHMSYDFVSIIAGMNLSYLAIP
jgi:hypothetical protein